MTPSNSDILTSLFAGVQEVEKQTIQEAALQNIREMREVRNNLPVGPLRYQLCIKINYEVIDYWFKYRR